MGLLESRGGYVPWFLLKVPICRYRTVSKNMIKKIAQKDTQGTVVYKIGGICQKVLGDYPNVFRQDWGFWAAQDEQAWRDTK
jgi:hypothetical protein